MKHLTTIQDIEQTIAENRVCLFYIKAPDCGVCNVMLDKVEKETDDFEGTEKPFKLGRLLDY